MLFLSHSSSLKLGNEVGECGVLWHDILSVPLGWISIMGWKRAGVIKRSLCKQSCEGQSGTRVECGECEDLAAQPALLECQQCASLRWETAVGWEEVRSRAGDKFLKERGTKEREGTLAGGVEGPPLSRHSLPLPHMVPERKPPMSSRPTLSPSVAKSNPRKWSTVVKTQDGESGALCSIPFSSGLVTPS